MKKLVLGLTLLSIQSIALAAGGSEHASQASKHSALAGSAAAKSTAQVASVAVAVPLLAAGSVGEGASALAESLENADHNEPLEVSEVTLTVGPSPADAMAEEQQ